MRSISRSGSDKRLQTPPHSRGPSLSGMKSLSGRLTLLPSAKPATQSASPHNEATTSSAVHNQSLRDSRRSLERSWSSDALSVPRNPIKLPEHEERKPRIQQPNPVPVVHSSVYLRQSYAPDPEAFSSTPTSAVQAPPLATSSTTLRATPATSSSIKLKRSSSSTDNALEWAMRRADLSLDELERNPLPLQKAFYEFSRGPVGELTNSAVQAAAKFTLSTGQEVTRASLPVGKWALSEGLKAAGGMMLAQHSKKDERKKT